MRRLYLVLALLGFACGDDGSEATGSNGTLRSDTIEVFPCTTGIGGPRCSD